MLKNNKNLIINILIFFILFLLFNNVKNIEKMSNEKDFRNCPIDLGKDNKIKTRKERIINYGELKVMIGGVKYECQKDCDCPSGSRCESNKCTREGTYACIDAKTGDCREIDIKTFNNSGWKDPLTNDFSGFKTYCKFFLNDPNNLDENFESLAINGGCPKNNVSVVNMEKIRNLVKNLD